MELEGNLILERPPTRRWVSVIAVIIPVLPVSRGSSGSFACTSRRRPSRFRAR